LIDKRDCFDVLAVRTPLYAMRDTVLLAKPEHFTERYWPGWSRNLRDYPHSIRFLMETHFRWIQKLAWEASFCPQITAPSGPVSLAAHAMVLQAAQYLSWHTAAGFW